ncbi:disease resistance protein RGA5-like [Miscanthus floridulus]|uniref:disease resistance protein RGA5-like n=1 Tax=Miscanthus floridulus TaxID=154761 RepID=UPI00345B0B2F
MEVYHKITEAAFDSRAFVSVSQTPDMKKLLRDILSQISKSHFDQSQMLETVVQLIRTLKDCLKDKRYFILIDDIWSVSAWELVRSALPVNDTGSRIITTTRIEAVAKSCCTAEALIPGQERESMEQLGRSYLNELINRSLVQPTKVGGDGATVKQCKVHDVILEFTVSKAVEDNFVTIWNGNGFSKNYSSNKIRRLSIQKYISSRAEEIAKTIKNGAQIRSINIFGSNSVLVTKHATEFLNSQVLRVLNIEVEYGKCSLGHVKSLGQLKYLRIHNYALVGKLPQDIEKLQHLETLDVRRQCLQKLPASIIQLQKLVRLHVYPSVRLPDGIRSLQALEELSTINLGIQSVKFIQGLGDLTNLKLLKIDWPCSTELRDMEDHKEACISMLSRLFSHLRELRVWQSDPDATCSFMASCVPTPPPLRKLVLNTRYLNCMGPQISSLVNLSRLSIRVHGEAGKEGINILASLPMLLSLSVGLFNDKDGDSGIVYPRNAINPQGFQRLLKFHFRCYWCDAALEFEPGAMPKLQRLKLELMARCQFKFGEGGLVLGLQKLAGLKHLAIDINCDAAVADEVEALENDIRDAAGVHPNSPMLQGTNDEEEDCSALEAILAAVPPEYREPLGSKDSAKEAWDTLKAIRVESDRARKAKAQQLRREYDDLAFRDGEAVEDFALRL